MSRILLALFFVLAGSNHFVFPEIYAAIVPRFLPWTAALVAISGAAEIAGGLGVLRKETRRLAGRGLIALLVAVFPANIQSIVTGVKIAGAAVPSWMLWARLPLQLPLIWWVYRACLTSPSSREGNQA